MRWNCISSSRTVKILIKLQYARLWFNNLCWEKAFLKTECSHICPDSSFSFLPAWSTSVCFSDGHWKYFIEFLEVPPDRLLRVLDSQTCQHKSEFPHPSTASLLLLDLFSSKLYISELSHHSIWEWMWFGFECAPKSHVLKAWF